jgi:hypothetical protein
MTTSLKCPECGKSFDSSNGICIHCSREHGMSAEALYRTLNPTSVGTCISCDAQTKFVSFQRGYQQRCLPCAKKWGADKAAVSRRANYKPAWNAGKTKADDASVAKISVAVKKNIDERGGHWNRDISKETHEYVAAAAKKRSATVKASFSSCDRVAWHKGLSAKTDERLKLLGQKLSISTLNWHRSMSSTTKEVIAAKIAKAHRLKPEHFVERLDHVKTIYEHDFDIDNTNDRHVVKREIYDFVMTLSSDTLIDDRSVISPLELDIHVPSKKFAIECHGLYWHSEATGNDGKFHVRKWQECTAVGVSLMQLYEDEWRDRRSLVEAMIRHRLGMSRRIHARRCDVIDIDANVAKDFLDANHIDGHVRSNVKVGLVHAGDLVGVATLRKPFHRRWSGHAEVARVGFMQDVHVVGGVSKLLNACRKRAGMPLMSYVDVRLGGVGAGYIAAGMQRIADTGPRFWWTDFRHRYNRFSIRADRDRGMTQAEVADENDVVRIWGPPNLVFADM